jgi:hypothetical protein
MMRALLVVALGCSACTTDIRPEECSQPEACNGVDDDCDSSTPEGTDADGDGYCAEPGSALPCCEAGGGDCDDSDEARHPGAKGELACTSLAGDQDGDGHNAPGDASGGRPDDDCCDADPDVFPGQTRWFTAADGETACGGWDYDCSGVPELEVGTTASCLCTPSCTGTDGWEGLVPACGASGSFQACGGGACGACPATTDPDRPQGCH